MIINAIILLHDSNNENNDIHLYPIAELIMMIITIMIITTITIVVRLVTI